HQATKLGLRLIGCAMTDPNLLRVIADALTAEQNSCGPWGRLLEAYESALEFSLQRFLEAHAQRKIILFPFPTLTEVRAQFRQQFGLDSWPNDDYRDRTMRKTCRVLGLRLGRDRPGRKANSGT